MARFAWESKVFPELNVGYPGDTRYWKQDEIRELIQYAKLRGVRVVPEIEMSTHAKALYPLKKTQTQPAKPSYLWRQRPLPARTRLRIPLR